MLRYAIGFLLGWFAHIHYAAEITDAFNRVVGSIQ